MTYPISKFWLYPLCKTLIRRIRGIENIPTETNFIIISNHEKLIDPLFIVYLILKKLNKKVHFLAKPTWWFLGETICRKWAGCIPLLNSEQAYNEMKNHIKKEGIIGIFPEGHLNTRVRHPKTGAVRLAIETMIPILPISIKSSYLPFNSKINIGKLVYAKKEKNIEKQTFDLMDYINKLRIEK